MVIVVYTCLSLYLFPSVIDAIEICLASDKLMQAKLCVNENIPVVPIPGPCALISALSASGLATDEFTFGK